MKTKDMKIQDIDFFKLNLWHELSRFNKEGDFLYTVTCTEENLMNLFESQFSDTTKYGEVFKYTFFDK